MQHQTVLVTDFDIRLQTTGGLRRLRVDRVLYQPEREGIDVPARPNPTQDDQDRRRI